MRFSVTIVPASVSPLIRDMHRQTKQFDASNHREAKKLLAQAFLDGFDQSGEWMIERGSLVAVRQ